MRKSDSNYDIIISGTFKLMEKDVLVKTFIEKFIAFAKKQWQNQVSLFRQ